MNEITNYFEHYFIEYEKDKNPIAGQILGLLMQNPDPMSLNQITKELSLSKAAISIQVRVLNDLGYCVKLPRKSDRKDYYKINDYFVEQTMINKIQKHTLFIEELNRIIKKNNLKNPTIKSRLKKVLKNLKLIRNIHTTTVEKMRDS